MRYSILVLFISTLVLFNCKKKEEEEEPVIVPTASIETSKVIAEGNNGATSLDITITLNNALAEGESGQLSYYVEHVSSDEVDLAAFSEENAELVTFQVGESTKKITIEFSGDQNFESDEEFEVILKRVEGIRLSSSADKCIVTIENDDNCVSGCDGWFSPESYAGFNSVWSDEFNGTTIDANVWRHEIGNGDNGWGNGEVQYYTAREDNSFIRDGNLVLRALNEPAYDGSEQDYTSARLVTGGWTWDDDPNGGYSFQYGRIDFRAKFPTAQGSWPALWLLGDNIKTVSWPQCGEIDVMEATPQSRPGEAWGSAYFGSAFDDMSSRVSSYWFPNGSHESKFHVYSIIWSENEIEYRIDNEVYQTLTNSDMDGYTYPYNNSCFLIMNYALGAPAGDPNASDYAVADKSEFVIDYVRVFQR